MKQRSRKRRILAIASLKRNTHLAVRRLTTEDLAALRSISESGLFSLRASREMYEGVRRIRPTEEERTA